MKEFPYVVEAFAQILQEARMEAGLSQQELAKRMRCARSFISAMENGIYQPTLNSFFVACDALDLDPIMALTRLINRIILLEDLKQVDTPGPRP